VMVYFGQDGCPYCRALMEANFSQRDIVETMQRDFVAIALNLWGDRETTWIDGVERAEKDLGKFLRVQFTPTLLFLDETGQVVLRLNGYQPPPRFRVALEYVAGRHEREAPFAQFLAGRERKPAGAAPAPQVVKSVRRLDRPSTRPTVLFFESRDCDACAEMNAALKRPDVARALAPLELVRVDAFGSGRVVAPGGAALSERDYARSLDVGFTPTLVFLDRDRKEVFRVDGYVRPFHLAAALAYVAEGAWRTEPNFQRYLQARADRERAAGRPVQLW